MEPPRYLRPSLTGRGLGESLYEKQGILEDVDTDHRDSADGTGNHARHIELYVKRMGTAMVPILVLHRMEQNKIFLRPHCNATLCTFRSKNSHCNATLRSFRSKNSHFNATLRSFRSKNYQLILAIHHEPLTIHHEP